MSLSEAELDGLYKGAIRANSGRYLNDEFIPFTANPYHFRVFDDDPFVFADPGTAPPSSRLA